MDHDGAAASSWSSANASTSAWSTPGRTVTVETADHTFRVYHDEELLAGVARTTGKNIARFKVGKLESARTR